MTEQDLALGTSEMGRAYSPLATSERTGATCIEVDMGKHIGEVRFTIDDPRIETCPTSGCWIWIGCLTDAGYGVATFRDKNCEKAHRAVWETNRGPIPRGMFLDHTCRVRCCVNPDHLRVVTPAKNNIENSVSPSAINAQKTACPLCGGPFTKYRGNGRRCIPCHLKKAKERNAGAEYSVVGSDGSVRWYKTLWLARSNRIRLSKENPWVTYTRKIVHRAGAV